MSQEILHFPPAELESNELVFITSAANELAYQRLIKGQGQTSHVSLLAGPRYAGKSHLAACWQQQQAAQLIYLQELGFPHGVVQNTLIEYVGGTPWPRSKEEALFHWINAAKAQQKHLLIVLPELPANLSVQLQDLRSRLQAADMATIDQPDDALFQKLIMFEFSKRQLTLKQAVLDYMQLRLTRSYQSIHDFVEGIDRYALRKQRPVTVPLVKDYMESQFAAGIT